MSYTDRYETYRKILSDYLASCDIEHWKAALTKFEDLHQSASMDEAETACLGAAGCVRTSAMLSWLSYFSGDYKLSEVSKTVFCKYSAILINYTYPEYEPFILARGMMLGFKGYTKEARKIVNTVINKKRGLPEIADVCWVLWDNSPIQSALDTKDFLHKEPAFLPVVHQYCSSLLRINRDREVREILKWASGKFPMHPLILDIEACLEMELRNWKRTIEIYGQSPWPIHQYSRLITLSIAYPELNFGKELEAFLKSDHTQIMHALGTEFQREYSTRSTKHLDYLFQIRFNSFYSLFEAGVLMFRKRCHREAYRCFTRVWKLCPDPSKSFFTFHFINTTWLLDFWPCKPELYELASYILKHYPDGSGYIRNWGFSNEIIGKEQLEPIFNSDNHYEIGNAYLNLGKKSPAIREFWLCLEESYTPRAVHQLIYHYHQLGCYQVIQALGQMILQEAYDDFFNLWELAYCLISFLFDDKVYVASHQAALLKTLAQTEDLMIRAALKDFQNLIRLAKYYRDTSRLDQAQKYIETSFSLAETAENFLLIAHEWRLVGGKLFGKDNLGEKALIISSVKSQNRTEQIEVAKEFCSYNLLNEARDVLIKLNIIGKSRNFHLDLSPLEWILVFDCEICMEKEEIEALVRNAFQSLLTQINGKVFCDGGKLFMDRLRDKVHMLNKLDGEGLWGKLEGNRNLTAGETQKNSSSGVQEEQNKEEISLLYAQPDFIYKTVSGQNRKWQDFYDSFFSFFSKENQPIFGGRCINNLEHQPLNDLLHYWGAILNNLLEEKDRILITKMPELPDESKPFMFSDKREELLVKLWQAKLQESKKGKGEASELLEKFYQEEVEIQTLWNIKLEEYTQVSRRAIKILTEEGIKVLEQIEKRARMEKCETSREQEIIKSLIEDAAILIDWLLKPSSIGKGFSTIEYHAAGNSMEAAFGACTTNEASKNAAAPACGSNQHNQDIFKAMVQHFQVDTEKSLNVIYQFRIEGLIEEVYNILIKDNQCSLSVEDIGVPSLTFSLSESDWYDVCEGNLTGKEAILCNKLKIYGDIVMASKVAELFKPL